MTGYESCFGGSVNNLFMHRGLFHPILLKLSILPGEAGFTLDDQCSFQMLFLNGMESRQIYLIPEGLAPPRPPLVFPTRTSNRNLRHYLSKRQTNDMFMNTGPGGTLS